MTKTNEGPEFVRFFGPVLDALRQLGGSARPAEVEPVVATNLGVSDEVLDEQLASGGNRFRNRVHWARFYLAKAGLLDSSRRGVWSLTEKGLETHLNHSESLRLFKSVHEKFIQQKQIDAEGEAPLTGGENEGPTTDHRARLIELLRALPPEGFERVCQRLLRESGFEQVVVTGRSGDGGLDGHGVLRINPLVSFNVYFQSKRYSGTVGPGVVRDFRGAMMGRSDKGIIITTGTFTTEARKESVRDGAPPIELLDAESLVDLFESLELGLTPRTVFEVNEVFFEEFGFFGKKTAQKVK